MSSVGKVSQKLHNWVKITQDPWVLQTVSGYKIHFDEQPYQHQIPREIPFSPSEWLIVDNEVQKLISKGAIVPSVSEPGEFISTLFIVPKANGKYRPVINLRHLNKFVHYDHFKQETFKVVLDLLQENDFMSSVDMADAYFSISIHPDFQKYLKFIWNGKLYKFICCCFGLKSAPFLFTKVLKPVYSWFRQKNFRCSYYIDDSLNMNQDKAVCRDNTMSIVDTLDSLGFTINYDKSFLVPVQRIVFFGFVIDSVEFKIFLTEEKVQKILTKARLLLQKGVVVVRELASFIGLIINAFYAVLEAPLHYRGLERNKLVGLGHEYDFNNETVLTVASIEELNWWIQNVQSKNGKRIRPKEVQVHCRTDASLEGWGSIDMDSGLHANGRWNNQERVNPIHFLELLAVFYALQSLYSHRKDVHIEIQTDNVIGLTYLNDMGGMASESMDRLAKQIWAWCLERQIYITAVFVPGILNTADFYSRSFSDDSQFMLKKDIFNRLCRHFFMPDIDLFASRLNKQLDTFVSWYPEPGSFHCNAFTMSWNGYTPYIFPPFCLIGKIINKIVQEKVEKAILVFPFWRSQSWFPLILDNMCSFPVRLPRHKDLLCLPHSREIHPLSRQMRILAVEISGRRYLVEEFQQKLQMSSLTPGAKELENSTKLLGECGVFGTVSGVLVHFRRLRL